MLTIDFFNFNNFSEKEQKEFLLHHGMTYFATNNKPPMLQEFEAKGISRSLIRNYFDSFQSYLALCGLPTKQRSLNLTDEELKEYLKQISIIIPKNNTCPSFLKKGRPCYEQCTCWLTTKYPVDPIENRQKIFYRGKTYRLYQLSHLLFKGSSPSKTIIGHTCDNSLCFNPDHLITITPKENAQLRELRDRGNHNNLKEGRHTLTDPYGYAALLALAKSRSEITEKEEWLYKWKTASHGYPIITINKKRYYFHRLILANKLGITYEEVTIARHLLPNGQEAQRHDLNPDHLLNGTNQDNANDKKTDWSLTKDDVSFIKNELNKAIFLKQGDASEFDNKLALALNTSSNIISKVRLNKTYKVYNSGKNEIKKGTLGKPVVQLDLEYTYVNSYPSASEAAKKLAIDASGISSTCSGKLNQSGGFVWIFADEYRNILGE